MERADVTLDAGDIEAAKDGYIQARHLAKGLDAPGLEGMAVGGLASIYHTTGEFREAQQLYVEAITLLRKGEIFNGRHAQTNYAGYLTDTDRHDEATAIYEQTSPCRGRF